MAHEGLAHRARGARLHRRVHDRDLHVPDDLPRVLGRHVPGGARARARPHGAPRPGRNPMSGEPEDTDVGFPGPDHHIAERTGRCAWRWARSRCWRPSAASCRSRGLRRGAQLPRAVVRRLPTFEGSSRRDAVVGVGLVVGAVIGADRHLRRLPALGRATPSARRASGSSSRRCTAFVNKWYFDEAIDFLVVRPFAWFGRFARNTFERVVVNGAIVGGTVRRVRAGSAAVRASRRATCATTPRCCCSASPPSASTS